MAGVKGRSGRRAQVLDVPATRDPIRFLRSVVACPTAPTELRLRAALALLRLGRRSPRLGKKEQALEASRAAARGKFAPAAAPKLALVSGRPTKDHD